MAPTEARGKTISIIMGGVASGTVLGVPLGLLLAERWGWQAAMWLIALIGVVGLIDRFSGPRLTFAIMLLLGTALIALPLLLGISPWLALIPIALWGAVGRALQVPQNND
ncbi:MFS transporter [Chromohalobacter israelensis]|uniref:MFS transporter n=1 Tax=Chromohalobacter israelensis TaxID=141390 RepID=UPI000692497B|nr:MFS transporter [Chromohalobacter israelensis]MDF9436123.1 MFS transporter [Chromohalobacter israelensis]